MAKKDIAPFILLILEEKIKCGLSPIFCIESFVGKGWSMAVNSVKVVADNCPHKGIEITVYDSKSIETIIRGYALAAARLKFYLETGSTTSYRMSNL